MSTSVLVSWESSLLSGRTPRGPPTLTTQEWHSPRGCMQQPWEDPGFYGICLLPRVWTKEDEMSSYCSGRKLDEDKGRSSRQKTIEQVKVEIIHSRVEGEKS